MPTFASNTAPVSIPSSTKINPLTTGIQLGVLGASAGLGYAAIHRAIRLRMGNKEPVAVVKPMLIGSLIGTSLGAAAGWKYGDNVMSKQYPETWDGLGQSIHDNIASWPKFSGLGYIVEKTAQQQPGYYDYSKINALDFLPVVGTARSALDMGRAGLNTGRAIGRALQGRGSWWDVPGHAMAMPAYGFSTGVGAAGDVLTALSLGSGAPLRAAVGGGLKGGISTGIKFMGKHLPRLAGSVGHNMVRGVYPNWMAKMVPKTIARAYKPIGQFLSRHPALGGMVRGHVYPSLINAGMDTVGNAAEAQPAAPGQPTPAQNNPAATSPGQPPTAQNNVIQPSPAPYDYGPNNAQPSGYGYRVKTQSARDTLLKYANSRYSARYGALQHIIEKSAQEQSLGRAAAEMGLYFVPGVGTALTARDALAGAGDTIARLRAGQYGRAGLSALGALGSTALAAVSLIPGGTAISGVARGLRASRNISRLLKARGLAQRTGKLVGRMLPNAANRSLSMGTARMGRAMRHMAPSKPMGRRLFWGGVPALIAGNAGPAVIDAIEQARQFEQAGIDQPPVDIAPPYTPPSIPQIGVGPVADSPLLSYYTR